MSGPFTFCNHKLVASSVLKAKRLNRVNELHQTKAENTKMSLLWNWGSRTLLRRCMPSSSSSAGVSNISTLSSPLTSSTSSIIPSRTPTSLSSLHLYTPLRFKGGVKTNSGAKKRFRVRGSGSIKRWVVWKHIFLDVVRIHLPMDNVRWDEKCIWSQWSRKVDISFLVHNNILSGVCVIVFVTFHFHANGFSPLLISPHSLLYGFYILLTI